MSIETQATFYARNVCDYDPGTSCDVPVSPALAAGFVEFSGLLQAIYQDWRAFETSTLPSERTKIGIMTNDLENYHNLTDTLNCLYAIAKIGELHTEGYAQVLRVNKAAFKTVFKKSVKVPFERLESHGFYFGFLKNGVETTEYRRCDCFDVHYENGEHLMAAMHWIADRLACLKDGHVEFMLADYDAILTGQSNQNPLQQRILTTLGPRGEMWATLVDALQNQLGLAVDFAFNPYVFPNRTITFKQGKKTIIKCGINVDELSIRLPLTFEAAKSLIENRAALPPSINQNIDWFDCVNCGKCQNKRNLEMVEGVPLCNLPYSNFVTEDSRCLRFDVTNEAEVTVICDIIRQT